MTEAVGLVDKLSVSPLIIRSHCDRYAMGVEISDPATGKSSSICLMWSCRSSGRFATRSATDMKSETFMAKDAVLLTDGDK